MKYKLFPYFFLIIISLLFSFGQNITKTSKKNIIDSLLLLINESDEDSFKISTYYQIASIYQKNNFDTTLIYLTQAENIAKKNIFSTKDKKQNSIYKKQYARILRGKGGILWQKGNILEAMNDLQNALRIFEDLNDKKNIASVYNDLGIIHGLQNNKSKALSYYQKCMDLSIQIGDSILISNCYVNIGNIYFDKKEYEQALEQYNKLLVLAEKINYKYGIINGLGSISGIYFSKGQYDEALEYAIRSLNVSLEAGSKMHIATSYLSLLSIYNKKGNFEKAIDYFRKGIFIAKEIGSKLTESELLLEVSGLFEKHGFIDTAFSYYKIYSTLKDSLLMGENMRKITELENSYRFELLKKENEIQRVNADKQKKNLYIVLTGLAIVMILMIIFFIQKIKTTRAYKELVHKNIELAKKEEDQSLEIENKPLAPDNYSDKYTCSGLTAEQKEDLIRKIIYLMEKDRLYLDPEFSVQKLSDLLQINRTYISQVINEKLKINFNHFINEYRVKEVRKQLLEEKNKNMTIEAIAYSVGFNSKSAFHSAFKKITGITPSFYIKTSRGNL